MFIWDWIKRRPASAVLIDMPNVENEGHGTKRVRISIVWGVLRTTIEMQLRRTVPVLKAGFHQPDRDKSVVELPARSVLQAGRRFRHLLLDVPRCQDGAR